MAEVAGLVIGGVALTTAFDSAMNAFDYIEAGAAYGRTYNLCALNEKLLKLRLSRWEKSVRTAAEKSSAGFLGNSEDGEAVQRLLGEIASAIEDAGNFSERYKLKAITDEPGNQDTHMEELISRVKNMAVRRQNDASLAKKARWALRDEKKYKRLIDQLRSCIKDLEELFPAEHFPVVADTQTILAEANAEELVNPSKLEQTEKEGAKTAAVLQKAATEIEDRALEAAVRKVMNAQQSSMEGHWYGSVTAFDDAQVLAGNSNANGAENMTGIETRNTYENVTARGRSQLQAGNRNGGVEFFAQKRDVGGKAQGWDDGKGRDHDQDE